MKNKKKKPTDKECYMEYIRCLELQLVQDSLVRESKIPNMKTCTIKIEGYLSIK